jgi:P-type E1-E2 ATPase
VSAARERQIPLLPTAAFTANAGAGVTATVDGRLVQIGNPATFLAARADHAQAQAAIDDLRGSGATAVVVLVDATPVAVFGIVDELRAEAAAAVARLTDLTGKPPLLLTGDNAATATRVAKQVGITQVHADLLPDGKVAAVRKLRDAGTRVTVVGDGINDAPALAAAHTGVAMGGTGSDLTLQTADAIVVRDDLSAIPAIIALSRRARRVVTANLIIAATFITGLVIWDLVGHLPLPLGVAGHEGSTVIVGLNGLRLLRNAAWTRAHTAGITSQ